MRFRRALSVAGLLLLVGALLFSVYAVTHKKSGEIANNGATAARAARGVQQSQKTLRAIVDSRVDECRRDHRFRRQVRVRAIVERKQLTLFLGLARRQVAAGVGTPEEIQTSRAFLAEFSPLLERIHILPLPDCQRLERRLTRELP